MALKKIRAAHWEKRDVEHFDLAGNSIGFHPEDVWIEQVEEDLSPSEEAAEVARWALGDHDLTKPQPLSLADEHEMLINEGVEVVKQKRSEYQAKLDSWLAARKPLKDAFDAAATVHVASIAKD